MFAADTYPKGLAQTVGVTLMVLDTAPPAMRLIMTFQAIS